MRKGLRRFNLRGKFVITLGSIVSGTIMIIFYWMYLNSQRAIMDQIDAQARGLLHQMIITRRWISDLGGVYIKARPGLEPNPLLIHYNIKDQNNQLYYLRNPAMATRELSKMAEEEMLYHFHLTSLKPKNPDNAPDDFERKALELFDEEGYQKYIDGISGTTKAGDIFFYDRIIPLETEASCLACHADQGYKVGDVRGGLRVSIPLTHAYEAIDESKHFLLISGSIFIFIVLAGLYLAVRQIVLKPVNNMYRAAQQIEADKYNYDIVFNLTTGDELESLSNAFRDMLIRIGETYEGSVKALANAIEARDPYTKGHTDRVGYYSIAIAKEMQLSRETIKSIEMGAVLHDIGKIGISDSILLKPDELHKSEIEEIRKHPQTGVHIVEGSDLLMREIPAVLYHHERYDGKGYPEGLREGEIPLVARIIAVADGFDAMTTERPYHKAMAPESAMKEILKESGSQYDPEVVAAFEKIYRQVYDEIQNNQNSGRSGSKKQNLNNPRV